MDMKDIQRGRLYMFGDHPVKVETLNSVAGSIRIRLNAESQSGAYMNVGAERLSPLTPFMAALIKERPAMRYTYAVQFAQRLEKENAELRALLSQLTPKQEIEGLLPFEAGPDDLEYPSPE